MLNRISQLEIDLNAYCVIRHGNFNIPAVCRTCRCKQFLRRQSPVWRIHDTVHAVTGLRRNVQPQYLSVRNHGNHRIPIALSVIGLRSIRSLEPCFAGLSHCLSGQAVSCQDQRIAIWPLVGKRNIHVHILCGHDKIETVVGTVQNHPVHHTAALHHTDGRIAAGSHSGGKLVKGPGVHLPVIAAGGGDQRRHWSQRRQHSRCGVIGQ